MAANEETVSIDTVKKTLWDSLEALGENISGETLAELLAMIEGGGGGSDLPDVTASDNGKVLGVVNGAWAKTAPIELIGTLGKDDDKDTITVDKTASELFDALKNGAFVKMVVEVEADGAQYRNDITGFVSSGKLAGGNDGTIYSFSFFTPDGRFMVCNEAAETDPVVFTDQ